MLRPFVGRQDNAVNFTSGEEEGSARDEWRNVTGTLWAANFEDPEGHKLSIFGPRGGN